MMAKHKINTGDRVKLTRTGQKGVVELITEEGKAEVKLPSGEVVVESIEFLIKILPLLLQLWQIVKDGWNNIFNK